MAKLVYGALQREIVTDDHTLAHLEAVTLSRLRRQNAFAIRWVEAGRSGLARRTIWLHDSADLYFEYDGAVPVELDRDLLDRMAVAADSNTGIDLGDNASESTWESAILDQNA